MKRLEEGDSKPKKSRDTITNASSDTVATEASINEFFLDQIILTESYDEEPKENMTDLRLLVVVRNSFDERDPFESNSISNESLSIRTQDAILADFVEEASSNVGREKYNATSILDGLHANKIYSMEDLLKLPLKSFYECISDRELAMGMKRLLDVSAYETPLDSTYEMDDFLSSIHQKN